MRLLALLLLVALLGGGYYFWKQGPGISAPKGLGDVPQQLKDTTVTGAVRTALSLHGSLKPFSLSASTENGVVTLRGTVPDPELKAAAERVAAAVPDVQQVVNRIEIGGQPVTADPGGRSLGEKLDDEALEVQVRMAFSLNKGLKGSKIEIQSRKKEIQLTGQASSEEQRRLAVEVARNVAGVRTVTDNLTGGGHRQGEGDARAAAEAAIRANPNLKGDEIVVESRDGRLVIRGTVRSGAERDLAGLLAREAARQPVDNALEVRH